MTQSTSSLESITAQVFALLAILLAIALSIFTILGIEARDSGLYPHQDFSYLDTLPKVTTTIFFAATAYFTWLSYVQYQRNRGQTVLLLLLLASGLIALGALVRLFAVFTGSQSAAAQRLEIAE